MRLIDDAPQMGRPACHPQDIGRTNPFYGETFLFNGIPGPSISRRGPHSWNWYQPIHHGNGDAYSILDTDAMKNCAENASMAITPKYDSRPTFNRSLSADDREILISGKTHHQHGSVRIRRRA
jgi:hypothetical protein